MDETLVEKAVADYRKRKEYQRQYYLRNKQKYKDNVKKNYLKKKEAGELTAQQKYYRKKKALANEQKSSD